MSDRLRIQSSERVDLSDFQHVAAQSDADSKELHANVFADPAKTRTWILEGFALTNPAAKQIQVALGRAILSQRVGGITQYGALTVAGDATKIVDLNAYTPGTYGVYVRFEEVESETAGRIFWDPAGDGSEYTQSIATRYVANWSVRVESSNPGTEWTKLGEVAQATMAITDQRNFYFEGQVDDTYESGWSTDGGGAANDRNADRQQYGCFDFQTFGSAMRQSLEDIKGRGLRRWWSSDIGGMNLGFDAAPVEDNLAIGDANFNFDLNTATPLINFDAGDGFSYNRGTNLLSLQFGSAAKHNWNATTWYPETNNSVDLGIVTTNRFKDLFLSGNASIANLLPIAASTYDLGAVANQFKDLFLSGSLTLGVTAGLGLGTDLLPTVASSKNFGSAAYPWNKGYLDELNLDPNFGLSIVSLNPRIILDSGDYFEYTRSTNVLGFVTGTTEYYWDVSAFYSDSRDIGKSTDPWGVGYFNLLWLTSNLSFYNAGSGSDRKRTYFDAGVNNLTLGGIDDLAAYHPYLQFSKKTDGTLNQIIVGSAANDSVVKPLAANIITLGDSGYSWKGFHTEGITMEHPSNADAPIYWHTASSIEEETPILVQAKNIQGSTITKGQSVAIYGSAGTNTIEVVYCTGPTDDTTFGVMYSASVADDDYGFIAIGGLALCYLAAPTSSGKHIAAAASGGIAAATPDGTNVLLGQVICYAGTSGWYYCHIKPS